MGTPIGVDVRIEDAQHGALEQKFEIPDPSSEVGLRVTGAGTVAVRLHPANAPTKPLLVEKGYVFVEKGYVISRHMVATADGPTSELRGWSEPGRSAGLRVGARGFRERSIYAELSSLGPTFLDVELEPS